MASTQRPLQLTVSKRPHSIPLRSRSRFSWPSLIAIPRRLLTHARLAQPVAPLVLGAYQRAFLPSSISLRARLQPIPIRLSHLLFRLTDAVSDLTPSNHTSIALSLDAACRLIFRRKTGLLVPSAASVSALTPAEVTTLTYSVKRLMSTDSVARSMLLFKADRRCSSCTQHRRIEACTRR